MFVVVAAHVVIEFVAELTFGIADIATIGVDAAERDASEAVR